MRLPASAAAAGSASISSRIAGVGNEPTLDHLGEAGAVARRPAASPASTDRRGPRRRVEGADEFFPAAVLIPVLPPTAASTIPAGWWALGRPARRGSRSRRPTRPGRWPLPRRSRRRRRSGSARPAELLPRVRRDLSGLGGLAVRHDHRLGGDAGGLQRLDGGAGPRRPSGSAWTTATRDRRRAPRRAPPAHRTRSAPRTAGRRPPRCVSSAGPPWRDAARMSATTSSVSRSLVTMVQVATSPYSGAALPEHGAEHGPRVDGEQRAVAGEADALGRRAQIDVEPDDAAAVAGERRQLAGRRARHRAPAQREDAGGPR